MRKLVSALPVPHRVTLNLVLDVLRSALVYRNKSRVATHELCIEWGPVVVGSVDKTNLALVQESADLLKTLIAQRPYLLALTEEPTSQDEVTVVPLKRKKTPRAGSSKSRTSTSGKKRTKSKRAHDGSAAGVAAVSSDVEANESDYTSDEEDDRGYLIDSIMNLVIASTIDNVLFDPRVRVSSAYEPKVPPNIKSQYTIERLIESATSETVTRSRSGSRLEALRDDFGDFDANSSALSSPRGIPGRSTRRSSVSSANEDIREALRQMDAESPRSRSPGARGWTKSRSADKFDFKLSSDRKMHLNVAAAQDGTRPAKSPGSPRSPTGSERSEDEKGSSRDSAAKLNKRASTGRVAHKSRLVLSSGNNAAGGTKKSKSEKDLHSHTVRIAENIHTREERSSTVGEKPTSEISTNSEPTTPADSRASSMNNEPQKPLRSSETDVGEPDDKRNRSNKSAGRRKSVSGKLRSERRDSASERRDSVGKSARIMEEGVEIIPVDSAADSQSDEDAASSSAPLLPTFPHHTTSTTESAKPPATTAAPVLDAAEVEKLKAEKKDLQTRLNSFKDEFVKKHGRQILYEDDKLEVQGEYQRYKIVRQLLADYESRHPPTADNAQTAPTQNVGAPVVDAAAIPVAVPAPVRVDAPPGAAPAEDAVASVFQSP